MSSYVVADKHRPRRLSSEPTVPLPNDLVAFVPYACKMMQAPFSLLFKYQIQDEYVSKIDKKKKTTNTAIQMTSIRPTTSESAVQVTEPDVIIITAVLDKNASVVELVFEGCQLMPRLLLKVIALCVPYQPQLHKVTVRRSALTAAALHELTYLSCLTDVCLNDSPVPEANYYLLLEELASLRRLSLDRCRLGDPGVNRLAASLSHPLPASRTLQALSLVTNGIGDSGARALALALRSNRTLMHLNLAGNLLTDEGFAVLLDCLEEFPLTAEELALKKKRLLEYLRGRRLVYERFYAKVMATREQILETSAPGRRKTRGRGAAPGSASASPSFAARVHEVMLARVEALTEEAVGPFSDPFSTTNTVSLPGGVCCVGNEVLCYLNVAHNELGYFSAGRLLAVLEYQQAESRGGLVRVVMEGNLLPAACAELSGALELLERKLVVRHKSLRRDRKSRKFS